MCTLLSAFSSFRWAIFACGTLIEALYHSHDTFDASTISQLRSHPVNTRDMPPNSNDLPKRSMVSPTRLCPYFPPPFVGQSLRGGPSWLKGQPVQSPDSSSPAREGQGGAHGVGAGCVWIAVPRRYLDEDPVRRYIVRTKATPATTLVATSDGAARTLASDPGRAGVAGSCCKLAHFWDRSGSDCSTDDFSAPRRQSF